MADTPEIRHTLGQETPRPSASQYHQDRAADEGDHAAVAGVLSAVDAG